MCLTVGMIGGPYVKGMVGKVKKTPVRSVTFHANLERIAVINLDTGIEKKGEQIYYAAKLIEYPDESYQTTSLEEAKDGMKKDLYGAYIIIPSTFSTAVDSINGTPQKAVFEYQINPHLEGQDRDNMIYELTAFQDSIRNNVSYVFLDAILKEVHNVQDGSMTILANDDSERENLSGVSAEELIQTVEFTELKENNEVISPIDLSKESEGLENTAKSIGEQFDNALDNGQQDYDKITDDQDSMLTALENLKTGVSKVNPLVDEKGKSTIENGITSVNNEIDESNKKVEGQRSLLEQSMVEEINSYGKKQTDGKLKTSRDNIENSVKENVFDAVNKKVDSSLKEQNIQNRQQVQKILEEYTLDLQRYLDQTVQGEIKASVKEITKENVEKTQKALNSKHASETEQLKQSYEKKLEEQRVSLEGQKALLEEQKNALEEQKTLLEEQKNSLEEQKNTLEVKIAEFKENQKQQNERFKQAAEAIRGAAEEEYNDQIQALLAQIDELKTEEENPEETNPTEPENPEEPDPTEPENPEEPKPTEPENPGETETTETENPETLSLAETEENVPMPNGDSGMPVIEEPDMTRIQKALQITGTEDSQNVDVAKQPVKLTEYLSKVLNTKIATTWEELNYSVAPIELEKATKIEENNLKKVENYYKLPKENVTKAFQEEVVDVISAKNQVLQEKFQKKAEDFSGNQSDYQSKLDSLMIQAEPERIQIHVMELYPENYEFEGFPKYKRSPRIIKRLPKDTIDIQTPMEKSVMGKGSLVQMILPPLLMTAVTIISSLVMKMGGFVIVTALTTVLTTIFTVTKYFDDRKACRQKNKRREELYEDYLVTKRKELNHAREKEIEAWSYNYPQIDEMERLIREYSPRIYERNIHDEDFMTVAVGYWDAEVNFKIDYENNAMKYETDELEEEGEHLKEIFGKIPQKPMIVDLKKAHLGIVGDRENVHEQLQILLTQLVFAQSYHDLQIITIYDKEYEEEFSWMKWLPHSKIRALNLRGLINSEQMRDQVLGSILQILKDRKMKCEEKKNEARFAPYFLFVIDEPKLISSHAIMEYIDNNGSNLAFSVIYTTQQMANLPDSIGTVMEVLDSKKGQLVLNEKKFLNKNLELYRVGNVSLEWMARNLSVLQHEQGIVSKIPENITFYEMYGIQQARELNAEQRWKKSQSHKSLAVPLGVRGNDEYVYLNLHEKAHGPHGLVAGTTGSGKSEIIQSYILSLAVNFHPYEVGFLLIDYKGGGMAGLFKNLPHLLGTITNLDGAESLRAMASIKSELKRRQRIFSEYGVNHINGYNKLFKSGEASVPIPHLFLISDEFAELKKEQPDFMAELISTARIGRSLGVHLILATQKPSGVVDDQIWSNSKFKLALKVQDEADSREILKTADAAFITQPGRAYLQVGNNEIYELFQSAWSGATVEAGGMSEQIDDRVYKINELGQGELLNENLDDESESGEKRTQLEAVVDYIEEIFEEQHCEKVPKPWLPSLPFKMISTIQEIKAMEKLDLSFPLGMVDIPDQQSQEEFWIDLETEGNFGFFSAAGYGKSTVLTNCILSLARKNRVSELNFYIFDFGNSALIPLKKLAHTADYMTYDDEEKRGKFFRLIKKEMKVRKQKFAQVSAQSFSVYNQLTDKPLKAIVIVVDNMDILRELDSDEEEEFTKIARDGAGLGIYLMFSALSENGVRYGTLNNIKVKVAGYMYDAADISGIVGRGEYKLPDKKGRAMVNYKGINIMQLYTAVPFENEIDYIEQIQSVVEQINVYYPQEKAQSIPILPETLTYSMLENYETADDTKADIILGLDVEEVKKEGILQMHSPFAVIGDNQRGKTNVMKCILNQLDDQASIYVFDSQSRELNSYREYGGITFIQSEEEVSGFVDEMTYLGESRKEEFMQALTENPEMTVSEFASKQQPVYVVVDQADTFTDMLNEEYEDEITEILERAVNMGVMMIFGIHASKFRGYDELTSWIKSTNHGLVLGDQGNAEIFPVPYQEKIEFTKGLLFRNGVSTKIMIPKC